MADNTDSMRLNRILSLAGICSRRQADAWIRAGRVRINGSVVAEAGSRALWGTDLIEVDGREIPGPGPRTYLMLNKPFGVVSSLKDPAGRPVVQDLLQGIEERVYPVGRLDFDSMGLLLLTNDGEWAYRLTHPRYNVPRRYKVTVDGRFSPDAAKMLRRGVRIDNGKPCRARTELIQAKGDRSILSMTITQGKNRQVRRMLEKTGYRVVHLIRTHIGPLALGDLKVGSYRHLETREIEEMKKQVGLG